MPSVLIKKLCPKNIRNMYTSANIILGRAIFGNIANFSNNYSGATRWKNNKKHPSNAAIGADVQELRETGVTIFKSGFPKKIISDIYKEYLAVIEDPKHCVFFDEAGKFASKEGGIYFTGLKNSVENVPSLKYIMTPELQSFVKQYYGSEFYLHSASLWRTKHISEEHLQRIYPEQPYSILWHVDGHPIDTLKMFIVLSDVTDEDGPLHYLTIQRTEELRKKGYFSRFRYRMPKSELEKKESLKKLVGPSGTAAFCNTTLCLHRAGVPAEGRTRDMLQLRFESSDKPFVFPESSDRFPTNY